MNLSAKLRAPPPPPPAPVEVQREPAVEQEVDWWQANDESLNVLSCPKGPWEHYRLNRSEGEEPQPKQNKQQNKRPGCIPHILRLLLHCQLNRAKSGSDQCRCGLLEKEGCSLSMSSDPECCRC